MPIAIASAIQQTFTNFELIVLDDASSDGTDAVVTSFHDPRISYVRNDVNLGMVENWNNGFRFARTAYVAFLHDDDVWAPQFLERTMRVAQENPEVALVYTMIRPIDRAGRIIGGTRLGLPATDRIFSPLEAVNRLVRSTEVPASGFVVRRDAFLETGGFKKDWPFSMDSQAWIEVSSRHPTAFVAEALSFERLHSDRLTAEYSSRPLALGLDRLGMLQQTIPKLPLSSTERVRLLRQALRSSAQAQLVFAWDLAVAGEGARARTEAALAFKMDRWVMVRAPLLVAGAYIGSLVPSVVPKFLNRWRKQLRSFVRSE